MVVKRLLLIIILTLCFTAGFFIGKNAQKYSSINKNSEQDLTVDVGGFGIGNKKAMDKIAKEGFEVIFQIKSGDKYLVERIKTVEEENLLGKKGSDIQEIYKQDGYFLKDINESSIILERSPIKYLANMYVLLAINNEIVIAKSNDKGSIFDDNGNIISKEGTGTKVTNLKPQDMKKVITGDTSMQFESIEKLNDGIRDFDIKYEMLE